MQGDFKESGGPAAVHELLDDRRVTFDALAAASDNMAIGAMKALQARGVRIPDDMIIAGLNDEDQSHIITPPLTTSPLHFFEQGYTATEMALDLLAGRTVSDSVVLSTQLLIRQSCGCPDPIVMQAAAPAVAPIDTSFSTAFAAQRYEIAAALAARLERVAAPNASAWIDQLLTAFTADLRDEVSAQLLPTLAELIRLSAVAGETVSKWHEVVSTLRHCALPCLSHAAERNRAENLWQQARVLIGETSQRAQAYHAWQAEQRAQVLSEINQTLNATLDAAELADVLAQTLPRLDIPRFCLSLYEDPATPADWSHFIVAGDERGRLVLDLPVARFPSCQLVPPDWLPRDRRYSLVVEPLYFREDQLGFLLFEADPEREEEYEALSRQISSTLKRTRLAERNVELYNEAVQARQVAEEGQRLAEEADSLKSRFLATVSHELRTPLTLIVGTIEMMLRETMPDRSALATSYHRDLKNIRASAQHLARLIGDVLDLASSQAGELRLTSEPLDLGEALQE
ncbi:MAG: substrate-binding domain-containing protein, partial [Chloroflexi bacterium]|nr:substrate-binding domain-containing protein [Chloroflexota bacterium]